MSILTDDDCPGVVETEVAAGSMVFAGLAGKHKKSRPLGRQLICVVCA